MDLLFLIILSNFIVSLVAFVGILVIFFNKKIFGLIPYLVALSAGTLIGGAFLHLLPESLEIFGESTFLFVVVGFVSFFFVESVLRWRHCHYQKCKVHTFAYMNLIGDAVHNFIDGLAIAASFITSVPLGFATTLSVVVHEIPQELGDFGVLIRGGFKFDKALIWNFTIAAMAILGGVVGYYFSKVVGMISFLLPFTVGGFIYIAATDLIPELHKEIDVRKSILIFSIFIAGITIMGALRLFNEIC